MCFRQEQFFCLTRRCSAMIRCGRPSASVCESVISWTSRLTPHWRETPWRERIQKQNFTPYNSMLQRCRNITWLTLQNDETTVRMIKCTFWWATLTFIKIILDETVNLHCYDIYAFWGQELLRCRIASWPFSTQGDLKLFGYVFNNSHPRWVNFSFHCYGWGLPLLGHLTRIHEKSLWKMSKSLRINCFTRLEGNIQSSR